MRSAIAAFLAGIIISSLYAYIIIHKKSEILVNQEQEILSYKKYSDYLSIGKQKLQESAKFLAATITREETLKRVIQKQYYSFIRSDAEVLIKYTAEYSFGYILNSNSYSITSTPSGIEIVISKPVLLVTPAVKAKSHEIPNTGFMINEKEAVITLYEGMDKDVEARGKELAAKEEIIALCEKKLINFLKDFLYKQPGVKSVPNITIKYK